MNKITTLFSLLALLDITEFYSYEYQPESSGIKNDKRKEKKEIFQSSSLFSKIR
jgi:hypothetical protein